MSEEIKYKIVDFDNKSGVIQVLYEGYDIPLNLDVPLDHNGHYPNSKDLDVFICAMCPKSLIQRHNILRQGNIPNEDVIFALVERNNNHKEEVLNTNNDDLFDILK